MSFTFRPAKREQVGLILGVAGASGSGKTYSAMRLASGMSGGHPFAVVDTEAGRAKHYADAFKFDHGDLTPPFTPQRYHEAIAAAETAGYPVIVVDSMSHEWAGEGGCLDMQEVELDRLTGDGDWKKREACKIASWIAPKVEHKRLVTRLLQCRAHLIFCFRAEPKIEVTRDKDGKMQIIPKRVLGWASEWIPVTEKSFLFEMTTSFVLSPDQPGVPIPIKLQEQHRAFFPLDQPITEQSGERLAAWAKGSTTPRTVADGPGVVSAPGVTSGVGTGDTSTPEPWELVVTDYVDGFEQAPTAEHAKGLLAQWQKIKASVPPAGVARVDLAITAARVRLKPA